MLVLVKPLILRSCWQKIDTGFESVHSLTPSLCVLFLFDHLRVPFLDEIL
ncbi:hypothetical protein BDD14_5298 [Edaphobacter modestus]|uniref:Uncharacterized protein n=1 Tax=Edaphobacter modestus TaxID=388466 RepID=A0A4Q7Z268_9BACT|nr:hypothetical protein BDD14_5298 [Edaphobacter modestus]